MIILIAHIVVALITTLTIVTVTVSAYQQRETKTYPAMLFSFGVTALSGVALLFVSTHGLGRFCAMMSMYALLVVGARAYYRKQLSTIASL